MLNPNPLSQAGTASGACLEFPESMLQFLVPGNLDCSTATRCGERALASQGAGSTALRIELDHIPRLECFHLAGGAGDCLATHVDREGGFGEKGGANVARRPGFRHDLSTAGDHF